MGRLGMLGQGQLSPAALAFVVALAEAELLSSSGDQDTGLRAQALQACIGTLTSSHSTTALLLCLPTMSSLLGVADCGQNRSQAASRDYTFLAHWRPHASDWWQVDAESASFEAQLWQAGCDVGVDACCSSCLGKRVVLLRGLLACSHHVSLPFHR